jgi:stage III sporulation protein AD
MDVVQLVGFGVAAAVLTLTLRSQRPEMGMLLALAAGLIIFAMVVQRLQGLVTVMGSMAQTAALPSSVLWLLIRVVGISYLGEFGAQMCRDAGENGIAAKVELGARILVLGMSVPVLLALMRLMMELIP